MLLWTNRLAFSTWWQQKQKDIIPSITVLIALTAVPFAGHISYMMLGIITFTQTAYLNLGYLSFISCLLIIAAKNKRWLVIGIPVFVTIDIIARLALSYIEIMPGVYWHDMNFLRAIRIFAVRLLFLLPVLGISYLRPKFGRLFYGFNTFLIAGTAFCLSAVYVPCMLHEPLYSHKVQHIEVPTFRAYALYDNASFLLDPSITQKGTGPFQARIVRKGVEDVLLADWDSHSPMAGFSHQKNENVFQVVLNMNPDDQENTHLRLIRYVEGNKTYEHLHPCPAYLMPCTDINCLSSKGTFVALNNGILLDFSNTETVYSAFEEAEEVTHYFIEWTAEPEERALYYHKQKNQVILIDPHKREQATLHDLNFREPDICSLTLAPNGQRLLYAGKFTDYFFLETIGTDFFQPLRVSRSETYLPPLRPFWINDTKFMYISQALCLQEINTEKRIITAISQILDFALWAYYERDTRRVIWTMRNQWSSSSIHACQVKPEL